MKEEIMYTIATISRIRRHIISLPKGELFTTRDMLDYGTRSSVDQALYRLVRCGVIQRLIPGVFVRPVPGSPEIPIWKIVQVKARAFRKQLLEHAKDLADQLEGVLPSPPVEGELRFNTDGRSSSFWVRNVLVRLVSINTRKVELGDSPGGKVARALCRLGKEGCTEEVVRRATQRLSRQEKIRLRTSSSLMPYWLSDSIISLGWQLKLDLPGFSPMTADTRSAVMVTIPRPT
jgi:hypothetical protein